MPSERVQRRIDRLLDEAEAAMDKREWDQARTLARDVLDLDPENVDALTFLAAVARRQESDSHTSPSSPLAMEAGQGEGEPKPARERPSGSAGVLPASSSPGGGISPPVPSSFANGRYQVKRFLGEGGKKRVYLAHDTLLDRGVAFALIKTEGLDDAGRDRIRREAQAMGRLGSHPHIVSVFDLGEEPDLTPGPLPWVGRGRVPSPRRRGSRSSSRG